MSLTQLVRTMYNIRNVRGSDPNHQKKKVIYLSPLGFNSISSTSKSRCYGKHFL